MTFTESVKKIFVGDKWVKSLFASGVPLGDMFESFREDIDFNVKQLPGEYFLTIETKDTRFHYWVTLTRSFKEWTKKNVFTGCSFEIIQQRQTRQPLEHDEKTYAYKSDFLDSFLVTAQETQILGDHYLDYKSRAEIFGFFGLGGVTDQ